MRFLLNDGNLTIKFETEYEAAYAEDLFSNKMQGKVIKKNGIIQEISIFGKAEEVVKINIEKIDGLAVEEIEMPELVDADFGEVSGTVEMDDGLGLEDSLLDEADEELLNMLDDDMALGDLEDVSSIKLANEYITGLEEDIK